MFLLLLLSLFLRLRSAVELNCVLSLHVVFTKRLESSLDFTDQYSAC